MSKIALAQHVFNPSTLQSLPNKLETVNMWNMNNVHSRSQPESFSLPQDIGVRRSIPQLMGLWKTRLDSLIDGFKQRLRHAKRESHDGPLRPGRDSGEAGSAIAHSEIASVPNCSHAVDGSGYNCWNV